MVLLSVALVTEETAKDFRDIPAPHMFRRAYQPPGGSARNILRWCLEISRWWPMRRKAITDQSIQSVCTYHDSEDQDESTPPLVLLESPTPYAWDNFTTSTMLSRTATINLEGFAGLYRRFVEHNISLVLGRHSSNFYRSNEHKLKSWSSILKNTWTRDIVLPSFFPFFLSFSQKINGRTIVNLRKLSKKNLISMK